MEFYFCLLINHLLIVVLHGNPISTSTSLLSLSPVSVPSSLSLGLHVADVADALIPRLRPQGAHVTIHLAEKDAVAENLDKQEPGDDQGKTNPDEVIDL